MRSFSLRLLGMCVLALLFLSCQKAPQNEAVSGQEKNSALSEDGTPIHFQVQGQGDYSLVFVHGWCTDMSIWEGQIPSFRVYYQVVRLDLAGHGLSGRERQEWTMSAFGQDVAAVVKKLDLKNVILIGHSMAGPVILEAARLLPERVIGLVGADTLSDLYLSPFSPEQIQATLNPFFEDFQEGVRRYALENLFRSNTTDSLKRKVILKMTAQPAGIAIGALESLLKYDGVSVLQQLKLPIRSINADRPLVYFHVVRGHTENFGLRFMNNIGHFIMMEDAQTFNRILAEFLGQIIQESYQYE